MKVFDKYTREELKTRVAALLTENPKLHAVSISEDLGVTEGEIVLSYPDDMVQLLPGSPSKTILEACYAIMGSRYHYRALNGIDFEVQKASFPKGKEARELL